MNFTRSQFLTDILNNKIRKINKNKITNDFSDVYVTFNGDYVNVVIRKIKHDEKYERKSDKYERNLILINIVDELKEYNNMIFYFKEEFKIQYNYMKNKL